MRKKNVLLAGTVFGCLVGAQAQEKPLDFWEEAIRTAAIASAGQHIDVNLDAQRKMNATTPPKHFKLDHTDKKSGDLSLVYLPGEAKNAKKVGFVANLWGGKWTLAPDMALKLQLKTTGAANPDAWQAVLVDGPGKTAVGTLKGTDTKGEWRTLTLPLKAFKADDGFDWTSVRLCEFEAAFGAACEVRFDGVRFEGNGRLVGVTDKPVSQRMAEADANRAFRLNYATQLGSKGGHSKAVIAFNKMMLNEDLEAANEMLANDFLETAKAKDHWSLLTTPLYCRFYYWFSNRAGKFPGRLKPEVEKQLLAVIWERTVDKNDMAWAKTSTWWLDGSENHDLNAKASNMVSSRIFMNEPDYKDRLYPDHGFGGAYHYGSPGYFGKGIDEKTRHGGGRALLKDNKHYKAADHYEAWLAFLKEYFRERAKRGFFLENSANGYTYHTMNFVDLAYQYSGDAELKKVIGDFLTLYWADWAQKEISGVHGGPKTRHKGIGGYDGTASVVATHLGGAGNGAIWWYWNLYNDYRLPAIVWQMALDREGMGTFVYQARGIGEEENLWPRPLGTERTLLCDTESRILKYSYVTPDYILGTQMDHPALVHSHLSTAARWQGLIFAQSTAARIVPVSFPKAEREKAKPDTPTLFASVQHKDVLIVQAARNYFRISPTWFPGGGSAPGAEEVIAVYIGKEWDRLVEKEGWIFVQKGNGYAAVRPVLWDEVFEKEKTLKTTGTQQLFTSSEDDPTAKLRTDCYTWSVDKTMIELTDRFSPIIIQAGRKADHSTLESFMAQIVANPIALYKTVVPGFNILTYTGGKDAPEIVYNACTMDIPTVGGHPVDYSHPKTFDSPYLQADYKSGKVTIQYGGETLKLNFNKRNWFLF